MIQLALLALAPALAQEAPPIVNGSNTSDWPAVGMMLMCYGNSCSSYCTGTLVHERWVITAAHCIDALDSYARSGYTMKFGIGPNTWNIQDSDRFINWYSHPQYNSWSLSHDIGICELQTGITSVDPMPINEEPVDNAWRGRELSYVGYGVTGDYNNDSGTKRFAEMPVYSYDNSFVYTRDTQDGQNICYGDSGGAALEEVEPGVYELVAANSHVFGVLYSNYMCQGGGSGAARVDSHLEWLRGYVDLSGYVPEPEDPGGNGGGGNGGGGGDGGNGDGGGNNGGGGGNGAPTILVDPVSVLQGSETMFKVKVQGEGEYKYFIYMAPEGGEVEVELDGWMRFIANEDFVGEDWFTVMVVDEDDMEYTENVDVEILERDRVGCASVGAGAPISGAWLALAGLAWIGRRRD